MQNRQRVGVARALANRADILLMDEPFGALDPIVRADLQRELKEIRRALGTTILFVTHDVDEAFTLGDQVAVLSAGGRIEHFHILGEWDQQPEKHIISSNTRMAKALAGKKPGETVVVPADDGAEVECVLKSVEELPAEIKEWMK